MDWGIFMPPRYSSVQDSEASGEQHPSGSQSPWARCPYPERPTEVWDMNTPGSGQGSLGREMVPEGPRCILCLLLPHPAWWHVRPGGFLGATQAIRQTAGIPLLVRSGQKEPWQEMTTEEGPLTVGGSPVPPSSHRIIRGTCELLRL